MKTVLPTKHLLYTLFLCLFCCSSLSVLAHGDDDGDGDLPKIPPPTRPGDAGAAVTPCAAGLEVIFWEEGENVEVEVAGSDGTATIIAVASVNANSRLQMDTRRWKRGTYTLRLKVNGRLVHTSTVQLR